MTDFQFCYNPNKHAPYQDTSSLVDRRSYWTPGPVAYLRYCHFQYSRQPRARIIGSSLLLDLDPLNLTMCQRYEEAKSTSGIVLWEVLYIYTVACVHVAKPTLLFTMYCGRQFDTSGFDGTVKKRTNWRCCTPLNLSSQIQSNCFRFRQVNRVWSKDACCGLYVLMHSWWPDSDFSQSDLILC
jgi:hypothetical protein